METGYFYSKSTGLYVAREPLKIDARVIKAASGCGIKLSWDDEGRINYISLDDGLLLLRKLGATMLTMKDYWLVLRDAKKAGDEDMARQLQSSNYAEWLNTTFEKEKTIQMPFGHPGWFNVEDVDYETGLPGKVELNREKYSASWKYWSFCGYDYVAAAVRGWVTSAGKPSLDLGIPANAVYPVLVIRECRRKPLHPSINQEILEEAERLVSLYEELTLDELYGRRKTFLQFFDKYGKQFQKSQEIKICQIREKMIEIRGILRLIAKSRGNAIVFQDFVDFAQSSRERLEAAVGSCKSIVFVMGHKNPDTDAVVSALAEAYRNHLLRGEEVTYIPVVQGKRVPDEIRRLLGERLSDYILLSDEIAYRKAAKSGQARWIMVDHNKDNEIQRFVVSIVDHHAPSEIALRQNTVKTLEMVGSTTALVVQKISGLGMDIPPALARILYGATLMDTENRSKLKMTAKDELIMGSLKEAAGVENDSEFYQDLMSRLLSTDDAELLFERDYKEDWAFFGFAVVKVKKLQKNLLRKLVRLARQNNKKKNLSLTIIKVVDYEDDNETINLERIYLIFNDGVFPEFKEVMFKLIEAIVNYTFKGRESMRRGDDFIEFWGTGDQLSRKRTVPVLEPVVIAFNQYFFSPSTNLYVKRDFLKAAKRVREAAGACGVELSWDDEGRMNNITYGGAVKLLDRLGFTALSPEEYWRVLKDAKEIKDQQMAGHLQSGGFVEFLHAIVENSAFLIEKPEITDGPSKFQYEGIEVEVNYNYRGKRRRVRVPDGKPGLIHPKDINLNTGLPKIVYPPNIYKDPSLWRYWSPDAEKNVTTRGHIFLLGQPALDLKVHLSEAFHCLGVRPCCRKVELPRVKITTDKDGICVTIEKEGETTLIRESDFFADVAD